MAKARRQRNLRPRRPRPASPDPLPGTEQFDDEIVDLIRSALRLRQQYRRAYVLGLGGSGGAAVSVLGSDSHSPTEAVVENDHQELWREDCRAVTERLRTAAKELAGAEKRLKHAAPRIVQIRTPAGNAIITAAELRHSLERKAERAAIGADYG